MLFAMIQKFPDTVMVLGNFFFNGAVWGNRTPVPLITRCCFQDSLQSQPTYTAYGASGWFRATDTWSFNPLLYLWATEAYWRSRWDSNSDTALSDYLRFSEPLPYQLGLRDHNGGQGGIRTHGADKPHNSLASCRFRPLSHLSILVDREGLEPSRSTWDTWVTARDAANYALPIHKWWAE